MAEGFGVNGGVWGWGASALVSYSITRWLDVTGGFRALEFEGSRQRFRPVQTLHRLHRLRAGSRVRTQVLSSSPTVPSALSAVGRAAFV